MLYLARLTSYVLLGVVLLVTRTIRGLSGRLFLFEHFENPRAPIIMPKHSPPKSVFLFEHFKVIFFRFAKIWVFFGMVIGDGGLLK